MTDQELLNKTVDFMKAKFAKDPTGHDWWHIYRVWENAKQIAKKEQGANILVVQLAALLHDIADWKFNGGNTEIGPKESRKWLESQGAAEEIVSQVEYIVRNISFKAGTSKHKMQTLEGKIVQDADRLDAIGAIGIARVFATGAYLGRVIYDPALEVKEYKKLNDRFNNMGNDSSLNHFYEKLLLVKDKMNTKAGEQLAESRHRYMENYLKEFYAEWEGKK